jgi:hypothetical protein
VPVLQDNDFTRLERCMESTQLRSDRTDINRVGERSFVVLRTLQAQAQRQDHLRPYIALFPSTQHRSIVCSELKLRLSGTLLGDYDCSLCQTKLQTVMTFEVEGWQKAICGSVLEQFEPRRSC